MALTIIGKLPAEFIAQRVVLRASEVALGFERGLLSPRAVVDLEALYLRSGIDLTPIEVELACLLSDQLDVVGDLIATIGRSAMEEEQGKRVWLFLIVDAIGRSGHSLTGVLSLIEETWSTWGHPHELYDIVWPPPDRNPASFAIDAGQAELQKYLSREEAFFKKRVR
jgi:hypothetical protein